MSTKSQTIYEDLKDPALTIVKNAVRLFEVHKDDIEVELYFVDVNSLGRYCFYIRYPESTQIFDLKNETFSLDIPPMMWKLPIGSGLFGQIYMDDHYAWPVPNNEPLTNPFPNCSCTSAYVCMDDMGIDMASETVAEELFLSIIGVQERFWHSVFNDEMEDDNTELLDWATTQGAKPWEYLDDDEEEMGVNDWLAGTEYQWYYGSCSTLPFFRGLLEVPKLDWSSLPPVEDPWPLKGVKLPFKKKTNKAILKSLSTEAE
jgi:hypothetical protein